MQASSLLLIISGSVAAYKALELIRLLKKAGIELDVVLTSGGAEFVTPLAVSSLSGRKTYTDLFSLTDEVEMGHIQLSRRHDLIVVAPASANLMAQMLHGESGDLAAATLLATDKPVLLAPAMNRQMWDNPATQHNMQTLRERGIRFIDAESGDLACGETGPGRMAEPSTILAAIQSLLAHRQSLKGKRAIVTAGPTHEPIDPVRYIGNRSSGKQGFAIAEALAEAGADVTLIAGPVHRSIHLSVRRIDVITGREMLAATEAALPADIFIGCAAVADWAPTSVSMGKLKKRQSGDAPSIQLQENPDILATVARHSQRPALVIGFAAETENLSTAAEEKRQRKGADWMLANDVSGGAIFDADQTSLLFFDGKSSIPATWQGTKRDVAGRLTTVISQFFSPSESA